MFDGFPRTEAQAEGLSAMLPEIGRHVDRVVLLTAPSDVLVKRISGRRSCPDCGTVYNVFFNPPQVEGKCDRDPETDLVHRADDAEETVGRRLEVYRELTEPLIRFYENTGVEMLRVDGDRDVDVIQDELRRAFA